MAFFEPAGAEIGKWATGGTKRAPILLKFGMWVSFGMHHRWVKGHNATQKFLNFETPYPWGSLFLMPGANNCWYAFSTTETRRFTVYPKKYAPGFCFAVLCCGYTLTDFPISTRLTSLALWKSNDCHSASEVSLTNMDKYFMWIHYERLHNHNKAKQNRTVCIFLGIYCMSCLWNTRRVYYNRYISQLIRRHPSLSRSINLALLETARYSPHVLSSVEHPFSWRLLPVSLKQYRCLNFE